MLHFSRRDKMYEYIEILSLRIKYRILSLLYAIKVISLPPPWQFDMVEGLSWLQHSQTQLQRKVSPNHINYGYGKYRQGPAAPPPNMYFHV